MPAEHDFITPGHLAHTLHGEHCALLEADAPASEVDAVLARYVAELRRLAATPARSPEQFRAKTAALATCVVRRRDRPAEIVGDYGLAASILDDLQAA